MFDGSGTSWRSVAPFLLVDSAKRKNSVKVNLGFIINVFFLIVRFVERPSNILKIRRSGIVSEVIQNRFELNLNAAFDYDFTLTHKIG